MAGLALSWWSDGRFRPSLNNTEIIDANNCCKLNKNKGKLQTSSSHLGLWDNNVSDPPRN